MYNGARCGKLAIKLSFRSAAGGIGEGERGEGGGGSEG